MRVIIISLLAAPALPCLAGDWCSLDSSALSFETTFEGESLPGDFPDFDVAMDFDPAVPGAGELRVTVNLPAADMGDPEMNAILGDPTWLHVEEFSAAEFRSSTIDPGAVVDFVANGILSLKGREQPVAVPFTWQDSGGAAEMRGEVVLQRTDFDVGSGEWASGDAIGIDVRLTFSVQLERCDQP